MPEKLRRPNARRIVCSVCKKVWYEGQVREVSPDHQKIRWTPVGHGSMAILPECPQCQGSLVQQ